MNSDMKGLSHEKHKELIANVREAQEIAFDHLSSTMGAPIALQEVVFLERVDDKNVPSPEMVALISLMILKTSMAAMGKTMVWAGDLFEPGFPGEEQHG